MVGGLKGLLCFILLFFFQVNFLLNYVSLKDELQNVLGNVSCIPQPGVRSRGSANRFSRGRAAH